MACCYAATTVLVSEGPWRPNSATLPLFLQLELLLHSWLTTA